MPDERYILTNSGLKVGKYTGAPSINDIALSLSRQPRFGGQSRLPWTVIEHSLFVEQIAEQFLAQDLHGGAYLKRGVKEDAAIRLHALLHDAHEALTGDIPSPFKSPAMRIFQQHVDQRIASALVPERTGLFQIEPELIHSFDARALLAEAVLIGPEVLEAAGEVEKHFGAAPHENDLALLARFHMAYPVRGETAQRWLIAEFKKKYAELRGRL